MTRPAVYVNFGLTAFVVVSSIIHTLLLHRRSSAQTSTGIPIPANIPFKVCRLIVHAIQLGLAIAIWLFDQLRGPVDGQLAMWDIGILMRTLWEVSLLLTGRQITPSLIER